MRHRYYNYSKELYPEDASLKGESRYYQNLVPELPGAFLSW